MQNQENFLKKRVKRAKIKGSGALRELHGKLKGKRSEEVTLRAKKTLCGLAVFLLSFVLSGGIMPLNTYPLSIALIGGIGKYYFAATVGGIVGGLFYETGWEYVISYLFVFAIRMFMELPFMPKTFLQERNTPKGERDGERADAARVRGTGAGIFYRVKRFLLDTFGIEESDVKGDGHRESFVDRVGIRLIISSAGGFICGLFLLISNDFSYYRLAGTVFMMVLCPAMSFLLSGLFDGGRRLLPTASVACAMLLSVYATDGATFLALTLSPLLAMLFTLIACKTRGFAAGLFVAVMSGLCFDPRCIPPLALSVLAYIALSPIKRAAALALAAGVCLAWSYYFFDITSFVTLLPPMLVALPLFLIFDKLIGDTSAKARRTFEENKYFAKSVSEESKNLAVRAKVSSLSEAFSSLSEAVSALSDKFSRPDTLGIRSITDRGFERTCRGCPSFDVCFGAEYDRTVGVAGRITSALHKKGVVCSDDLGEDFLKVCVRSGKLVDDMNSLCSDETDRILRSRSMNFFASSYDDIKDVLQDAVAAGSDEYECDTVIGEKIYDYLKGEGYDAEGVVVCGKRCRRVMIKGVSISGDAHDESAQGLCRNISEIVGAKMVGPVFEVGDDGVLMMFSAKPKLGAVCASGRRAAFENEQENTEELRVNPFDETLEERREELCGDVTNTFLTDTSYFYSLISDGMGSGEEAAMSAGISSVFCEKMLMAGNRADITIRMLNNFLRGENSRRGVECSVTVDLFELDLMLGVASFIKSGAAPTYILRGGEVYRIASKTMPVGIIKNPDIKVTRFDMRRGDLVLMMSDGISGESDECEWIAHALCEEGVPDATGDILQIEEFISSLRDKLLNMAGEKMRAADKFDDVSLSVVLII